jgi:site-specific recombinase XerD
LTDLFEGWAKEVAPAHKTVVEWRKHILTFVEFIGQDDPRAVSRSNVLDWKQHLLSLGNSPKTISGSKLAALKSVFGWALENGHIEANPAAGVSVRRGTKAGSRMRGFERAEAAAILKASAQERSPVYRWVPLLCAQAGARVSEICQLRARTSERTAASGSWTSRQMQVA